MLRRWRLGVVVGLAAAAVLSACADEDGSGSLPPLSDAELVADGEPSGEGSVGDGEEPSTTTSEVATTETTSSSAAVETAESDGAVPMPGDDGFDEYIAGRVEAYYEVLDEASAAPSADPRSDHPAFEEVAAGSQLDVSYDAIITLHDEGQAYREAQDPQVGTTVDDEHRISPVISVEGDVITVFDCEVDDDDIIDVESGEVVVEGTLTILRVVEVTLSDGDWKVTGTEVSQKLEGVGGCYLASEAEFPF